MRNVAEELKGLEIKTTSGSYLIESAEFVSEYDDEISGQVQTYRIVLGQKLGRDDIYPENYEGTSGDLIVVWEEKDWDISYFGDVKQ